GQILAHNYPPEQLKPIKVLEDVPADEIYEVEAIVDHKSHKDNFLYRVRWAGYDAEDDTWEPPEHFNDTSVITRYWKRRNPSNNIHHEKRKHRSDRHNN
ncbi:hypothetical protein K492DRAFT_112542, partial [Lichtheimia hyalospora FSU 10163]